MFWLTLLLISLCACCLVRSAPDIGSRRTGTGFHTRLDYEINPDPSMPARCLFVWHRLPPYLYVEPEELARYNATVMGSINIEASTSQSHPFAYCFVVYNSSKIPFHTTQRFSINVHSRYLDPSTDETEQYQTLYLPEPVIHFTKDRCPHLGSGCPAPLSETGIESPRELTVTIPVGQQKHLWFIFPLTCLLPIVGCTLLFIASGK
jgi:hypothetical protein